MQTDNLLDIVDGVLSVSYRRFGSESRVEPMRAFKRRSRRVIDYPRETAIVPVIWVDWYFSMTDIPEMPQPGDELLEPDGTIWTLYNSVPSEMNQNWRCAAFRYEVSFGLDEHIDLLSAETVSLPDGEKQTTYAIINVGISAKFSPVKTTYGNNPNDAAKESHYVLVRKCPEIERLRAIRRADGGIYRISEVRSPAFAAGWFEIEVETP